MVDPDHLETILNNLVENSIKYSGQTKEIQIGISSNQSDVKITVADKGMGIPRKAQKKVFDKFYRVENSMTGLTKGHGLGLSIVKNMVELNGGKIDLKSEVNKGSIFSITFPARQISAEEQDEAHEYKAINIPDRVELEQYARQ